MVLLLGAGGCTSEDDGDDRATAERETCEKLLGDEGLKWIESRTEKDRLKMTGPASLTENRADFRRQVLEAPKEYEPLRFNSSSACVAKRATSKYGDKSLSISYGPSEFPFNYDFGRSPRDDRDTKRTAISVGPDVKLTYWKHHLLGQMQYYVYVRCGVPGSPGSQLNEVPLEGHMTDQLTTDPSTRTHLQHLLHSAKVMADAFNCTNRPKIPSIVPVSAKD
jgi:hypothetical protein